MPQESSDSPKSLNADWPAYITFINRTNYPVDIVWIDYRGKLIRYRTKLGPGEHHYQNTYMTHPWIAWNSETMDKACVGGDFIFQPKPWRGEEQRTVVFIDRPLHPLLELCVQRIRSLVGMGNIEELEIPRDLFDVLRKRRRAEFQDYHSRHRH